MRQYTIIYKYGKRARQLKIKRELYNFPSRNNGGRRKSPRTGLNEKEVIELLKDLSNILRAFSIKQLFHSGLLDMRSALRACLRLSI